MGTYIQSICHLTGYPTVNYPSNYDLVEYIITLNKKQLLLRFTMDHENSDFVEGNKHILHGMLLNGIFPAEFTGSNGSIMNNPSLEKLIRNAVVPVTPAEKINSLLDFLHSLQEYEGSLIRWPEYESRLDVARRLYFKNEGELSFYLFTLKEKGFISGTDSVSRAGKDLIEIQLTYEGLAKVIEISEVGPQSQRCFVALSFSEKQRDTRNAIKLALRNCGFDAILVDEQHIDSDVTINDAILAEIKKSKFVVADFTEHKHGVYFEAGFALGLRKPVIYLCAKEDFNNTHFDTNHYPHIVYATLDELSGKLESKIEAWIK